jgi:hypothetical protein
MCDESGGDENIVSSIRRDVFNQLLPASSRCIVTGSSGPNRQIAESNRQPVEEHGTSWNLVPWEEAA